MPGVATNPYQKVVLALSKGVKDCTPLERLAVATSLQPGEVVLILLVCLLVFGVLGLYNYYTVTLLSALYPIYMSFKGLHLNDQQHNRRWLTYWLLFALLVGFDRPLSQLLFFLPHYYTLKMIGLLLLQAPRLDFAYKLHRAYFEGSVRRFRSFSGMY